jgi:hypothetical protein
MLLARAGKPTKKAHNGRRLHAWQERRKRLLFENARARRIALAILREEATIRKQAGRAEREFERREWEQLREWLREHGGMLITIGNPR